jgi:hypothetical protein
MDALVLIDDDTLLDELGLTRGTMHPVDHGRWSEVYDRVESLGVVFDSGGSCANTIATIGRLGAQARYCGQVGDDNLGEMYAQRLKEHCGGHRLQVSKATPTGKCLSLVSPRDAERTMVTDLGAALTLPSIGTFAEDLQHTKIAHFTGYTLLDGPMRPIATQAIRLAHEAGTLVSLDAADPFVVDLTRDLLMELCRSHVDILFVNEVEAQSLAQTSAEEAIGVLTRDTRLKTLIVKLGSKGSLVWHEGELHRIEATPVKAVDTTGAGDAYAGGYLYGLTQGWSAKRSAELATRVAALTVSQLGAVVRDDDALQRAVAVAKTLG